jgi:hypothetical protein
MATPVVKTRCLWKFDEPDVSKLGDDQRDDVFMLFYHFYRAVNDALDLVLNADPAGTTPANTVLTRLSTGPPAANSLEALRTLGNIPAQFAEFQTNKAKLVQGSLILSAPATNPGVERVLKELCQDGTFTGTGAPPSVSRPRPESSPYTLENISGSDFADDETQKDILKCFVPLLQEKVKAGAANPTASVNKTNCESLVRVFTSADNIVMAGGARRKRRTAKKSSKKLSKKASQKGGAKRRSKKAGSKKASKKAGSKKAGSKKASMKGGAKRRSKKASSKKVASKKVSSKKISMKGGKRKSRAGSKKVASKKVASKKKASKKASMKGGKRRSSANSKKGSKKGSKKVASKKRASKKGSKSRTRK